MCHTFLLPFPFLKLFSRMRSKGSRFTLGVWGLRMCSLDVAQPSATVRNRPQPFATVTTWVLVEGSLEVKLPTIWRDEEQSREEA